MTVIESSVLGFPRVGPRRELKRALERFWNKRSTAEELLAKGVQLRELHWRTQVDAGMDRLPVGDFSFYDHVLDTAVRFGIVPPRARADSATPLDTYFRMARGRSTVEPAVAACDMTKWFDTNYHYMVPELANDSFEVQDDLSALIAQARPFRKPLNIVLLGPVTLLRLARPQGALVCSAGLDALPALLDAYRRLLRGLPLVDGDLIQLDEPAMILDLDARWCAAFVTACAELAHAVPERLLVASYFGSAASKLSPLLELPIAGVHVDLVSAPEQRHTAAAWQTTKTLSLGVVDGRNVWRTPLRQRLADLRTIADRHHGNVVVSSSCSLLHCPYDLDAETDLDGEIRPWLAFGRQKLDELRTLRDGLVHGDSAVHVALTESDRVVTARGQSTRTCVATVRGRVAAERSISGYRDEPHATRAAAQHAALRLPPLPTTTIGSFPQTAAIRDVRAELRAGVIDRAAYDAAMRSAIAFAIAAQERAGLDVLVHGEPERTDMVEYFGEHLDGMLTTEHAWVQSYGSRCVKPPVIYGDVSRATPITLGWTQYAQSQTHKPVKGMLTGPVTIMKWAFVRDDVDAADVAEQIAFALHDEVADLQANGIGIIQIDEPAFREAMPLVADKRTTYIEWATRAFRIAASAAHSSTQIHTHMCYSEFNDILDAIERLDADVLTVEAARSGHELLEAIARSGYKNDIGPGVYDVHSPEVPTDTEIERRIRALLRVVPVARLWINPDCGLKTRRYEEVAPSLAQLVIATKRVRESLLDQRVSTAS